MTIEQVNQFSKTAQLELVRDWQFTVMMGLIALLLLAATIYLLVQIKKTWKKQEGELDWGMVVGGGIACAVASVGIFVFAYAAIHETDVPAEGAVLAYKAQHSEWNREYVLPYIQTIPLEKEVVTELKYNYLLGEKGTKTALEVGYYTPIEAVTESGRNITGWAQIKPLEKGETEHIEYVYLEKELRFGVERYGYLLDDNKQYPSGYYRIVAYTNSLNEN